MVTEIRELIFPEDRPGYDELIYRRSSAAGTGGSKMGARMDYYDTHRVSCFEIFFFLMFHIRVTFHFIIFDKKRADIYSKYKNIRLSSHELSKFSTICISFTDSNVFDCHVGFVLEFMLRQSKSKTKTLF